MATDKQIVKRYGKIADEIIKLEPQMQKLNNEDFAKKTLEFKKRLQDGETLDDILIEAFALAREAANRKFNMNAYRVQLIGGIILHYGDIAEMKTGEGKTLTGVFPAYLNALNGKGVHIVTVNEYLSKRDSEINGQIFSLLGITVGLNGNRLSKIQKKNAYAQDITYTTNAELGFDYLRDNLVQSIDQKVQRGLNYAIIDEADSILIDEARTPLIISGGTANRKNLYEAADQFAKTIDGNLDIKMDLESKQVFLNESGMEKARNFFSVKNLFAVENTELFHLIMNALKAHFIFKEGVEYAVNDGEIKLIDQFTGRIMEGRSYSDGLQQAIQAKEGVNIDEETSSLATITYQNFYRLYSKLAGMTGTAKTEEEEFLKIYNTRVITTPTNRPIIRKDESDYTFGTKNAALKKLVADIKEVNEIGNPILIGTTSVESSEQIARYLAKAGLKFETINAKNHDREAEIIAKAGQKGAITLATNMAGRGTDIKLSDEVKKLGGGLYVFGVERNEARRIDNQLRGRSGRQGDPGRSRFYISMQDEMMVRFTTPKTRQNFLRLGDDHIKSRIFTRAVSNAQKKLEGMNFDQRKDVLDYDNILAQQRETIYSQRDEILMAQELKTAIKRFQYTIAYEMILKYSKVLHGEKTIDSNALIKAIDGIYVKHKRFIPEDFAGKENSELAKMISDAMMDFYTIRISDIPEDVSLSMERRIILESFDKHWIKHIDVAGKLRSGIYLQQYAQNNPLSEYIEQATRLYNNMKISISEDIIEKLSRVVIRQAPEHQRQIQPKVIEIKDSDIDDILKTTGIKKTELKPEIINKKIDDLIKKEKDNKSEIEKLNTQRNILLGLVNELQKRAKNFQLSKENIDRILKRFGFDKPEQITLEAIENKFNDLLKTINKDNPEHKIELEFAKKILTDIFNSLEVVKTANKEKEFVIEDTKTGKVSKRIRRKADGKSEIIESDEEKREPIGSKTKIG